MLGGAKKHELRLSVAKGISSAWRHGPFFLMASGLSDVAQSSSNLATASAEAGRGYFGAAGWREWFIKAEGFLRHFGCVSRWLTDILGIIFKKRWKIFLAESDSCIVVFSESSRIALKKIKRNQQKLGKKVSIICQWTTHFIM